MSAGFSKRNPVENVPPEFVRPCRETACRVRRFRERNIPLQTFRRNICKIMIQQTGHRAERSCSLRPRKAVAFLTHLLRVPRSMGTGNFAVCGQRLRGHVPSKNTSPAALSWSSLTSPTTPNFFVSTRNFLDSSNTHSNSAHKKKERQHRLKCSPFVRQCGIIEIYQ